jgi:hypothetical protein
MGIRSLPHPARAPSAARRAAVRDNPPDMPAAPKLRRRPTSLTLAVLAVLAVALLPAGARAARPPLQPGIWVTPAELQDVPTSGEAWSRLVELADEDIGDPELDAKNSAEDVETLAAALVYARTGDEAYREKAAEKVMEAIGTEEGGRTLSLARGLQSYVIAADLIDLRDLDRDRDEEFRRWLRDVRNEELRPESNPTLVLTHELRPNNWGTHAGASRIAADVYLDDREDLARAAAVFKGYLGDRRVYRGFVFGDDASWQADPAAPVGINPAGARRDGDDVDGVLPDDMRRGCELRFPPCETGYPWEALQGAVVQAELLSRQGYDAWNWQDKALLRAVRYLYDLDERYPDDGWAATGDDSWMPWLLNARYGDVLPTDAETRPGKGMGFADWTHSGPRACDRSDCTEPRGPRRWVRAVAPPPGAADTVPDEADEDRAGRSGDDGGGGRDGREQDASTGLSPAAVVGIAVGGAALLLLAGLLVHRRRARRRSRVAG